MINKVAFINGKGGCGKTTSIFHVSGVLAKEGEKVLVIDFDKQRNTTDTLLMNTTKPEKTVFEFMQGKATAAEVTEKALFQSRGNANPKYYGVDCMTASVDLENEEELKKVDIDRFGAELDAFINEQGYTWVLVDMPPSSKELNNICFSRIVDFVIAPFTSDIFSISGYGDIVNTVDEARLANPSLNILGIYLSRYMQNCAVDRYIKQQLESFEPLTKDFDTLIPVQIPHAADVREAVMFGRPISYYKTFSDSRRAYENLTKEMKRRIKENH